MTLAALSALDHTIGSRHALPELRLPDVTLSEAADTGAVFCAAAVTADEIADGLADAIGCTLPLCHGGTTSATDRQVIWMSPRSWLVLCPPAEEDELVGAVQSAFPDRLVHGAPFSDYLCWFALEGDGAEAALRQGSFVTFDPEGLIIGHAKRTPVAGIPAVLLRDGPESWRIGIERSRATYFLRWLQSLTAS